MIKIQKANKTDFPKVYELLKEFKNRNITREDFELLFSHPWKSEENDFPGFVMTDNDKTVGFLGTIFSKRMINDKPESFCNLSSWIVKKEYRMHASMLLMKAFRLKGHTITNFSLRNEKLVSIFTKCGFQPIENSITILLPMPSSLKSIQITNNQDEIKPILDKKDLALFEDHKNLPCFHVLMQKNNSYCYIILSKARKKIFKFNRIHYISNPQLFVEHSTAINTYIRKLTRAPLTSIDSRFLGNEKTPYSFKYNLKTLKVFKSKNLTPNQIDSLYSEFILLRI